MTIFLRKCTTGGSQVDRSVDKLTAFLGSVNERVGVFGAQDLSLRNSVGLHEPRQMCRLLHIVAMITPVL
jgi:hypothetical protein